ncbi:30S ribosomal protein S4 [candidate division TA06 bacterium]|uniref:Small ribosomal subunit protein uS4 n=1 Tax=candidate division TA06 bacterium TaxID=2250710 RepID=A0A523UWS5_UNCT6|nr:MAG: 30S ribosomal protein S4 [candidate division TA06 bacterium]
MGAYRGPVCRLCRREGVKLLLKGDKCSSDKCALEKRQYPPGEKKKRMRRKVSGYGLQLREKQKARRIYGIRERQFHRYYEHAAKRKGVTGDLLLQYLERRLDNVVYRLGFAPSRPAARQLVRHRHFQVNNRIVDIPSYLVEKGDDISLKTRSKGLNAIIKPCLEKKSEKGMPAWLSLDRKGMKGLIVEMPKREEIPLPIKEELIIELYSK